MSTYFSIRCDGPQCQAEAHRRLSSPEMAIPGNWHVLKMASPDLTVGKKVEDLHFCTMGCLGRWALQDPALAATVPMLAAMPRLMAAAGVGADQADEPEDVDPAQH